MQRVGTFLFFIFIPVLLFSEEQGGFSKPADLREFRTRPPVSDVYERPVHPAVASLRYTLYPPRQENTLYIRLSDDSPLEISLLFGGEKESLDLRLPSAPNAGVAEILLADNTRLEAVVLPPGRDFSFEKPADPPLFSIRADRPGELILNLPAGEPSAESGERELVSRPEKSGSPVSFIRSGSGGLSALSHKDKNLSLSPSLGGRVGAVSFLSSGFPLG